MTELGRKIIIFFIVLLLIYVRRVSEAVVALSIMHCERHVEPMSSHFLKIISSKIVRMSDKCMSIDEVTYWC